MQFSLKALLVVMGLCALGLAMPFGILSGILAFIWYLVPGVLIVLVLHGDQQQRVFAWGALASFVALTLGSHVPSMLRNSILGFAAMALSGVAATAVYGRLTTESGEWPSEASRMDEE